MVKTELITIIILQIKIFCSFLTWLALYSNPHVLPPFHQVLRALVLNNKDILKSAKILVIYDLLIFKPLIREARRGSCK